MTSPTRVTKLDNGVTVVTRAFAGAKTSLVKWSVIGGSQIEGPDEHGVGHFLEHVLVDHNSIYMPLDMTGGVVNAYTSHSHIAMHAAVLADDVSMALHRIVQNGLIAPPFGEKDFAREKEPIKEEITSRLADPDTKLDSFADLHMYGADAPLAHFIAGQRADIDTHSAAKLHAYFARVRKADGLVVYGAGKVNHRSFVRQVEKLVKEVPSGAAPEITPSYFHPGEAHLVEFNERAKAEERPVHLVTRFRSVAAGSPQLFAYRILGLMMSGGLNAPLYHAMRHEGGLVYSLSAHPAAWKDDGLLEISITTNQPKLERALTTLANALARIPDHLTEDRFDWAKRRVAFSMLHQKEGMDGWASRAPSDLLTFGRVRDRSEIEQSLMAVTLADVKAAVQHSLSAPPFVAALGPVEGVALKAPFEAALSKFYAPKAA